jgi:hypothetical protein
VLDGAVGPDEPWPFSGRVVDDDDGGAVADCGAGVGGGGSLTGQPSLPMTP